jgi:hypothetical protein
MRAAVGLGLAAAVALSAQSFAQEGAAPSPPGTEAPQGIEEVVVRGRRMSEVEDDLRIFIGEFIGEVAAPANGRGLARWRNRVCVGIHNLERNAAQYIVDRIARLAVEVGLEPGEPGCGPDVVVIFTTDGKATAAQMVESEPRVFRPAGNQGGTHIGRAALDDFARSDKAVRWWHVSLPVGALSGVPAIRGTGSPGTGLPVVGVAGPSRIHSGIRDDLQRVIIIVDGQKLTQGMSWEQLGDYLAVVSLAQIDPQADPTAFDSILNLFSNPAAYSGLTDWDRSYMRALYSFDQERIPRLQRGGVISKMAERELASGE